MVLEDSLRSNNLEPTTEERTEIRRVNKITRPAFRNALLALAIRQRHKIGPILHEAFDEIYAGVEVEVEGEFPSQPAVLVANHPTHSLHHRLIPKFGYAPPGYLMIADSLFRQEFGASLNLITRETKPVNTLIDELGYIKVDQRNPNVERVNSEVRHCFEQGAHVAVCPEGHFYGERENNQRNVVGPFQRGFYHFAQAQSKDAPVPVVPVSLKGFNRAGSTRFSFEFSEPLDVRDFDSAKHMAEFVRSEVFGKKFGFDLVESRQG